MMCPAGCFANYFVQKGKLNCWKLQPCLQIVAFLCEIEILVVLKNIILVPKMEDVFMVWVNWDFISVQRCWCLLCAVFAETESYEWLFYLWCVFFLRWLRPLRLWGIWLSSWCRTTWPEQRWRRGQTSCPSRSLWSNSYRDTSEYRTEDSPSPSDPRYNIVDFYFFFVTAIIFGAFFIFIFE